MTATNDEQAMYDEPFADLGEGDGLGAPVSALELADAERLADVLDRIDAGGAADLDPREDPTLTALTAAAGQLREAVGGAASTTRFASYRSRSREYVLQRIERERAAKAAASAPARPARGGGIPFPRWNVLSPIASAAAAAVAVLAFVVLTDDGATAPAPAQVASVETPAAAPATPEAATPAATATEQATPVVRRVVHPSARSPTSASPTSSPAPSGPPSPRPPCSWSRTRPRPPG